jgi:transcriptional regulator with XRE-family HTH domain
MRKAESAGEIGMRLKDIRIQLRVSQRDMAETLQIAPSYLCEIESGRANPGPEFFVRLIKHYNVNLNYVFGDPTASPTGTAPVVSAKPQDFSLDDEIDSIEEIVWLLQNSKYFKNTILAYANETIDKDRALIEKRLPKK